MAMSSITKYKAVNDLIDHMETFLEDFDYANTFPHQPPDTAIIMARHAFAVLEILEAGEDALREDGELKEES